MATRHRVRSFMQHNFRLIQIWSHLFPFKSRRKFAKIENLISEIKFKIRQRLTDTIIPCIIIGIFLLYYILVYMPPRWMYK